MKSGSRAKDDSIDILLRARWLRERHITASAVNGTMG
jgi:hypothetical protein